MYSDLERAGPICDLRHDLAVGEEQFLWLPRLLDQIYGRRRQTSALTSAIRQAAPKTCARRFLI